MKTKDRFLQAGLITDEKARRRLNTSNGKANITADQIEAGVTIEDLDSIGVPVYRYEGQVTIHGKLPRLRVEYCGGYKSLIVNKNGSIGVKYVAIDNEKKKLIHRACREFKAKFTGGFNSQGFRLVQVFRERDACAAAFHEFPRDLIHGSIWAAPLMFGGYGLFVEVGCVDIENMDALLTYLVGKTANQCEKELAEIAAARAVEQERRKAESLAAMERAKEKRKELIEKAVVICAASGMKPLRELPKAGRVKIINQLDGETVIFKEVEFAKRGPVFCYKSQNSDRFRKYEGVFDKALERGCVYPAN